jgi:hypothetical protein
LSPRDFAGYCHVRWFYEGAEHDMTIEMARPVGEVCVGVEGRMGWRGKGAELVLSRPR